MTFRCVTSNPRTSSKRASVQCRCLTELVQQLYCIGTTIGIVKTAFVQRPTLLQQRVKEQEHYLAFEGFAGADGTLDDNNEHGVDHQ